MAKPFLSNLVYFGLHSFQPTQGQSTVPSGYFSYFIFLLLPISPFFSPEQYSFLRDTMKAQIIPAAGLLLSLYAQAQSTIYSGTGFGTYYYDIEQIEACGADFEFQNLGYVECSLLTPLSLNQVDSNYIVAMNHTQLVGDMALYCGKRVIVSVNGIPSSLPLFIGDGCERCGTGSSSNTIWNPTGAPGLDFSYSVLSELSASACDAGHISISWEIVDDTLYDFDTNAPGSPEGPVGPGSGGSKPTTTAVPTTFVTTTTTTSTSTKTSPSGPCVTGTWQCNSNGKVLEECLNDTWAPQVTCPAGLTCQGGNEPYCAPPSRHRMA